MSVAYHSPADILRHIFVLEGLATLPTAEGAWPVFVGHLPDEPDSAICIYDTQGTRDGRLMTPTTGHSITHPGWQIRVRAKAHPVAWSKAQELIMALDAVQNYSCPIELNNYVVGSVTQTSGILSLGREQAATRREQLAVNGTVTIIGLGGEGLGNGGLGPGLPNLNIPANVGDILRKTEDGWEPGPELPFVEPVVLEHADSVIDGGIID